MLLWWKVIVVKVPIDESFRRCFCASISTIFLQNSISLDNLSSRGYLVYRFEVDDILLYHLQKSGQSICQACLTCITQFCLRYILFSCHRKSTTSIINYYLNGLVNDINYFCQVSNINRNIGLNQVKNILFVTMYE